jgi:hypothetical protein
MGGSKVNYTPPPPDNTFAKYLEYQQEREKVLDDRAEQERAEAKAEEAARKASGAAGYAGLKTTTQQQLAQGLIGYESAANQLRDYAARYELTPPEARHLRAYPTVHRSLTRKEGYRDLCGL